MFLWYDRALCHSYLSDCIAANCDIYSKWQRMVPNALNKMFCCSFLFLNATVHIFMWHHTKEILFCSLAEFTVPFRMGKYSVIIHKSGVCEVYGIYFSFNFERRRRKKNSVWIMRWNNSIFLLKTSTDCNTGRNRSISVLTSVLLYDICTRVSNIPLLCSESLLPVNSEFPGSMTPVTS